MYRCPTCKEQAFKSDQTPCPTCYGWGVVVDQNKPPSVYAAKEDVELIHIIPMYQIRDALNHIRTGYEDTPPDPFIMAIVGRLIDLSSEHTREFGEDAGDYARVILAHETLILEPSGIWVSSHGSGVRIHRHPIA